MIDETGGVLLEFLHKSHKNQKIMQYKNVITGIVVSEAHYIQMDAVDKVNWMAVEDDPVTQEEDLLTEPVKVKKAKTGNDELAAIFGEAFFNDESDTAGEAVDTDSGSSDFGGFDGGEIKR